MKNNSPFMVAVNLLTALLWLNSVKTLSYSDDRYSILSYWPFIAMTGL